jgi:hypothetical protein
VEGDRSSNTRQTQNHQSQDSQPIELMTLISWVGPET